MRAWQDSNLRPAAQKKGQEARPGLRIRSSDPCSRGRSPPPTGAARVTYGTYVARNRAYFLSFGVRSRGLRGVGLRQAPCLPLQLPMPCRRLAVKDAEGAAERSKMSKIAAGERAIMVSRLPSAGFDQ